MLSLPGIMFWIRGGKLERLAIFYHFTVAFWVRFPMQWGPFVSPNGTASAQHCSGGSLTELSQPCDKLISPVKEFINQQWSLAQAWCPSNIYTASRPEPVHQQSSYLHGEDVSTASCQCLNCTFSKSLDQWYYPVLCSFVGGLLHAIQARICSCSL